MGVYADIEDIKARAGRLRDAWSDTTQPNDGDLERFIRDAESLVGISLAARGYPSPAIDPNVIGSLGPVVADIALMMTLAATWPGGTGGKAASALYEDVQMRVQGKDGKGGYLAGLKDGTLAAFAFLASGDTSGTGSSSFWTDEQGYSAILDDWQSSAGWYIDAAGFMRLRSPMGPGIHRDTKF